jgi:hypothetical protein
MTRPNFRLAALAVAAIVALVAGAPVSQAQTVHFVGAGSSAQFFMAAIAADQAAINANTTLYGGANTIKHWTKKFKASTNDGAYLNDSRKSGIVNQTGNVWLVWIENSGGSATDVWVDVSVDSTVGVRCTLAELTDGIGCHVQITSSAGTISDNLISPSTLWPDNAADVAIDVTAIQAINTSVTGGVHVNVGLTDIRPEDASFATKRLICTTRNATTTCLGDQTAANIGGNITSNQGTGAFAQPVGFALPGEKDPFNTTLTVPTTFVTYPVGAAPVVFVANNNAAPFSNPNLVSGVTPDLKATGQSYPLANLFDGSTSCDTNNLAFGGPGTQGGTALTIFLREPLSGTMNTTEFNLFRSEANVTDSQEGANGGAAMNFSGGNTGTGTPCTGNGQRSRAIGTGEVVGSTTGGTGNAAYGVLGTPNSMGYIFTGWANLAKYKGSANYQYLTIDNIDPLFAAPTAYGECVSGGVPTGQVCGANEACSTGTCTPGGNTAQTVPYCSTSVCTSDLWPSYTDAHTGYTTPAGASYPNVRNGLYKAWTLYRWIAQSSTDPYGPSLVAQEAQNYVNEDVADFIPFAACPPGQGNTCSTPTDGLSVYRSHFKPAAVTEKCPTTADPSNGSATTANTNDGGNTLGGGPECGGDVGGLIGGGTQTAFGISSPSAAYVTWKAGTETKGKGWAVTYKNGDKFSASADAAGTAITLICTDADGSQSITQTTIGAYSSATAIYAAVPNPDTNLTIACQLISGNITHGTATTPGVLSKKQ